MKYFKICCNLIKRYMHSNILLASCVSCVVILKHIENFPFTMFLNVFVGQAYLWFTGTKI